MKVLSVASECVPLVKTGGLADVVGALPGALAGQGVEMRVLLPAYPGLLGRLRGGKQVWEEADLIGGPARVLAGEVAGLSVMLLDAPHFFARSGLYGEGGDYPDNPERFAALSWAASELCRLGAAGWRPDLLHAHDWQAGLAPAYLKLRGIAVPSVLTIHNIAFQGLCPPHRMGALRLPVEQFHDQGFEYYGQISALKAGLRYADKLTTVSPTYAEELMRPEFGMGLEGLLQSRAADLQGILNGVDEGVWNPAADPAITPYALGNMGGKAKNRAALLAEFGLAPASGPLAIVVSRLTGQKGIDLLPDTLPEFLSGGGALALLGSGEGWLEDWLRHLASQHPGQIGLRFGYDEALAHRMFAGADAVLVPSRFEPCGLTQMYGLRYGTIPLVAATGGLNDTVIGATPASAGVSTGVSFHPVDHIALRGALRRLTALYADRKAWSALVKRAMKADVSWAAPAAAYARLFRSLA